MKNIIKAIIPLAVFLILLIVCIFSFNNENNVYHGIYGNNTTYFETDAAISIMYETDNGNYEVSDETSWLLDGYRFNETLSGCENGGTISWNDATQKVEMKTNISDKCYIYFDKYLSVQITNVTASNITSNSITVNVSATPGTNQISKYYYSINNGSSYKVSSNSSYTFTGLNKGTKYNIKVYAVDTKNYSSNIYSLSATTDDALLLADYIIDNVYVSDGVNGLYYHDGVGTYTNADQEAGDNSYRYSGANPNNYVCFGSDAATCPDEYLYRIIGVFDENSDGEYNVKLIKADYTTSAMLGTDGRDYYGNYNWETSYYIGNMATSTIVAYSWNYDTRVSSLGSNNWTTSELNKINLNKNYLNYLGGSWSSMIEDSTWYLGGMTSDSNTSKSFYTGERNNAGYGSNPTTYGPTNANGNSTKIGLMYVSDYGYASDSRDWNLILYDYFYTDEYSDNNWLYMGLWEWTITPYSSISDGVFSLCSSGYLYRNSASYGYSVRPVFYLKSNISYESGNGTKTSPFKVRV